MKDTISKLTKEDYVDAITHLSSDSKSRLAPMLKVLATDHNDALFLSHFSEEILKDDTIRETIDVLFQ